MEKTPEYWAWSGSLEAETAEVHAHSTHQLLRATEGLMLFEDAHTRHILSGPNAAFIPKQTPHRAETVSREVRFQSLYFSDEVYADAMGGVLEALPVQIVVFRISPLWGQLLQRLCSEPRESEASAFGPIEEASLRLLGLLFEQERKEELPIALPQAQSEGLKRVLEEIDGRFDEELSLERLSRRFFMSKRTLQRLFRKELGLTPSQYLRLRRIFEATILLSTTGRTILDVSGSVGYESLSAFYHAFSAVVGQTPRQFRQAQRPL